MQKRILKCQTFLHRVYEYSKNIRVNTVSDYRNMVKKDNDLLMGPQRA